MHDENGPAALGEQGREPFRQVRIAPDTQDQHLSRRFAQLVGQLDGDVAETQLRSHFQPVYCLCLGPGIEERAHAMGSLGRRSLLRQDSDISGLGGDVSQDTR